MKTTVKINGRDMCSAVVRFGRGQGKRMPLAKTDWKRFGKRRAVKIKRIQYQGQGVWA